MLINKPVRFANASELCHRSDSKLILLGELKMLMKISACLAAALLVGVGPEATSARLLAQACGMGGQPVCSGAAMNGMNSSHVHEKQFSTFQALSIACKTYLRDGRGISVHGLCVSSSLCTPCQGSIEFPALALIVQDLRGRA